MSVSERWTVALDWLPVTSWPTTSACTSRGRCLQHAGNTSMLSTLDRRFVNEERSGVHLPRTSCLMSAGVGSASLFSCRCC